MFRRVIAALVATVVTMAGLAMVGVTAAPVAAAPTGLTLEMPNDGGELLIRDAEEPYALESPTTVTGTIDDASGVISGASLATPPISFQQPVLGGALIADIDATFTEVTPGTATGDLDPNGNLTLRTALKGDLHIEVPGAGIVADCTTSPVNMVLGTTVAYDPATDLVTVSDPNFTIPEVSETSTCQDPVRSAVNESLAGSGHALTITLAGELTLPSSGTEQSTTTLDVDPAGGATLSQEVTLTATVAPGPDTAATDPPTGSVDILDGTRVIGQAPVTAGVATFTTTGLGLGDHSLTASYRGDSLYVPSTSAAVPYTVTAAPLATVDLPERVTIGADPVEFDLELSNPPVGADVENVRVDVTLGRAAGDLSNFTPSSILLEVRTGPDTWEPVPLETVSDAPTPTVTGSMGALTGRPLPVGATLSDTLRISFPTTNPQAEPGPLDVKFATVAVDPATGEVNRALSTTTGRLTMVIAQRQPTEIYFPFEGFLGPVTPNHIRQGDTLETYAQATPSADSSGASLPNGPMSIAIDGQPMPFWGPGFGLGLDDPPVLEMVGANLTPALIDLPTSVGVGPHTLTVSFAGDGSNLPSSRTVPFTVVEPFGARYLCKYPSSDSSARFIVQARTFARLPSTLPAGGVIDLKSLDIELETARSFNGYNSFDVFFGPFAEPATVEFDMGPGGSGSAESATVEGSVFNGPDDPDPDISVHFDGESATVPVIGTPGDIIRPTLDRIRIDGTANTGAEVSLTCEPVGEPVSFDPVVVAGTVLSVDAPQPTRAGDLVTLTAAVAPPGASGSVGFFDGDDLISLAGVRDGQAVAEITLPEGTRSLTARFYAGASGPSSTSDAVTVKVLPAIDCAASAEEGNAAVVRLTYLELLGRCPDPAGLAYWTGKLDDGASRAAFASSIAYTGEALGRVVDDGYQTILGRDADTAGRAYWVGRLRANGRYEQLLADLAASNEFWVAAGSNNGGYVELVYERVLGRPSDPDGRGYWLSQLYFGKPRRAMVTTFARLSEPLGRIVEDSFDEILGRTPTGTERAAAMKGLRFDGDRSGLYARLIGTAEFVTRAQGFPNPED